MTNLVYIGMQNALTYRYENHQHTYWEITYYSEGEGVNTTGGVDYPFSPGTIICQPPDLDHEDRSPDGYKNYFFMVNQFALHSSAPIIAKDTANRDFLYILKQLFNEYYTDNDVIVTNALLNVLYEYLLRRLDSTQSNPYAEILKRRIASNFADPRFSVLQEIGKMPLSVSQLRRLFEAETGMAPHDYLQTLRLSHAKKLLANSSRPINDICYLCGYSDPYYFSRIFKKYCGVSPSLWRKNKNALYEYSLEIME